MKDYLRNSAIMAFGWLAFLVMMVISGMISETYRFLVLLVIPGGFLVVTGLLFTYLALKYPRGYAVTIWPILGLVFLDQGIKLLVYFIGVEQLNLQIIPDLIYLQPQYNTYGSYLGSLLGMEISNLSYIVLYIVFAFFIIEGYHFYLSRNEKNFWTSSFYLSLVAGICASSLDKLLWGKTLDTLYIKPLFVCDIKDFYITYALFFLGAEIIRKGYLASKTTLKEDWLLLKEFFHFIGRRRCQR